MKTGLSLFTGCLFALTLALGACGGGGGSGSPPAPSVPPSPREDTFAWTGNTRMQVFAGQGILANDPPGTIIAAADSSTALGGEVVVDMATGAFLYRPPVGLQNTQDTFTYTVTGFPPVTVTIALSERIWYVRNNDTGGNKGTLSDPFLTLAQAEAASDVDDTIFVFSTPLNDLGQDAGITLKNGQKLLGKGVGLKVNGVPIVNAFPNTPISNGALGVGATAPVVLLPGTTGNEVAGFTLLADFNEGVLAVDGRDHDIHANTIVCDPATGREGIRLLGVSGSTRLFGNTISAAPGEGIKIVNNEDLSGIPAAPTPVTGSLDIAANRVTSPLKSGIRVEFDGAGTDIEVHLLTNTVTGPGNGPEDRGISVSTLGTATVSAVLSGNDISGSSAEGVGLRAAGSSTLRAFVANNHLSGNAAATDFTSVLGDGSTAGTCLEILNNGNDGGDSTFAVANNATDTGTATLFDGGDNDTPVTTSGTVIPVTAGACGLRLEGSYLFQANCTLCHRGNGLGGGNVGPDLTNATPEMITFQLANNPTMAFITLTPQEVQAIAAALAAGP